MQELDNMLKGLNEQQKEAVITTEGYVRVIAGAGSGKTKALTNRYGYIVKYLGIKPSNILCVTFTNKAAQEMKNRVSRLIGEGYDTSLITTYHGFCARVLREDINHMSYPENFIILDEEDQKAILRDVYEELGLTLKYDSFKHILGMISNYKEDPQYVRRLINVKDKINPQEELDLNKKIILMYLLKQKKVYGLDFDDLINFTFVLYEDNPKILEKWQNKLQYIQVDEFQDSSMRQYLLVQMLARINGNLFVVGDPDQTIYEWRGAMPELIVNFDKVFNSCQTIVLSENYRSTPQILSLSNSLIKRNELRVEKEMNTQNASGQKVIHFHGRNEEEEVKWITDKIKYINKENGVKYRDVAILYRANYISRFIEQGLINAGIDYTIYGGIKFFERKEIKDALAYLRLIASSDDLSFMRIVNVPKRKIGKEKINFLKYKSEEDGLNLYETLKKYQSDNIFNRTGAKKFIEVIEEIKLEYKNMTVSDLLQTVLDKTGYEKYLREDGDGERLDNIAELSNSIVNYEHNMGEDVSLENYLTQIALYTDIDSDDRSKDTVKLMTIHTAKGLEFKHVFLCSLSDGVFPSSRSLEDRKKRALEEERRLAYVAITRAMKALYLTESEGIGNYGIRKYPSRFLFEIEEGLYERIGAIDEELMKEVADYIECNNKLLDRKSREEDGIFEEGKNVEHPVFGVGVIEKVDFDEKIYKVKFEKLPNSKPISFDYKMMKLVQ